MNLTFEQYRTLTEQNPRVKKEEASVLARRFNCDIDTIKEYRKKLRGEKKINIFGNEIEAPSLEDLEAIAYRQEANKKVPVAPDNFSISSFKLNRDGTVGETWLKAVDSKDVNHSNNDIDWSSLAKTISKNTQKSILPVNKINNKTHTLYCISDIHCGMLTEGWHKEIMLDAFKKIGNSVNKCEDVTILMLGDGIDGLSKSTVRGGHTLPQDMSNQEQILNLVTGFQILFDILADKVKQGVINSFSYESVYESNHSGDMDYVVSKFLEMWLNAKYPNVECNISNDIWNGFTINNYSIWYSHGKDAINSKYGLPMNLNEKSELYITHLLKQNFGNSFDLNPKTNLVITGDLHTEAFSQGKFFKYYKVPAMSPSSDWVKANYGYSIPGVQYFNFIEDRFETGIITL